MRQPTPPREPASSIDDAMTQPAADSSRTIVMHGNRLDSRDIFQSSREIVIAHGEDTYRLRLTAQKKLILTK